MAACLLSVLISNLLLSLSYPGRLGLTSGFKGRCIPSLSSDLDTDAFKHRSGVSKSLVSEILNEILTLPSETMGFAGCSAPVAPTISIQHIFY